MQSAIVMAYLVLMLVIGLYFARSRVKDSDDFMVAGRSLPQWILAGTLLATFVGSGTIVGGASFIYQFGPFAAIFFFAGTPIGIIVLYFFLADRIRGLAKYTVPEILEIRYGAFARAFGGITILLAYVGIASYQFTGGGYALNIAIGIPVWVGTIITAFVVIFLATVGGLISVAYTDAISAVIILAGLLIGLPLILSEVGGLGALFSNLPETQGSWNGGLSVPQLLGYFLPLLLLLLGDQNVYQRFSSAESPETARRSAVGFFVGAVAMVTLVTLLASASIILLPEINPDTAVLALAGSETLPTVLGGFLLAAAVGIIITTGNSYLLSSAGNFVYDIYLTLFGREIPEGRNLLFDRLAVVALGALAYVLGAFFPSVLAVQIYSYTIYGAGITPALVAALVWRRATAAGGVASIVVGAAATLVWEIPLGRPFEWNSVLVALPLSIVVLVVVSLLTGGSSSGQLAGERAAGMDATGTG